LPPEFAALGCEFDDAGRKHESEKQPLEHVHDDGIFGRVLCGTLRSQRRQQNAQKSCFQQQFIPFEREKIF